MIRMTNWRVRSSDWTSSRFFCCSCPTLEICGFCRLFIKKRTHVEYASPSTCCPNSLGGQTETIECSTDEPFAPDRRQNAEKTAWQVEHFATNNPIIPFCESPWKHTLVWPSYSNPAFQHGIAQSALRFAFERRPWTEEQWSGWRNGECSEAATGHHRGSVAYTRHHRSNTCRLFIKPHTHTVVEYIAKYVLH